MDPLVPVLVYDPNCAFCLKWIGRWEKSTGTRVRYLPYEESQTGARYGISGAEAAKAVQLVEPDGRHYHGAAAVFRTLRRSRSGRTRFLATLGLCPGLLALEELAYRWIAAHRSTASKIQRQLGG